MQLRVMATILLTIMLLSHAPIALSQETGQKAVLVLMDNITWSDIIAADDPTLNELIKNSSIGLMNNRAFKAPSRPRNVLTVGAGVRAEAGSNSLEAYNAQEPYGNERAMDAYRLRTGRHAKKHQVLELGIASIVKDNDNGLQEIMPGKTADMIESAGKKVAVLGNSDISIDDPEGYNREAVAIAMNSHGVVEYGDIGRHMLIRDADYPFGLRTNYATLEDKYAEYREKADFIVIDLGDTVRADFYERYAFKRQAEWHKTRAIHDGAAFIKQLIDMSGHDTTFIIASLTPPGTAKYPIRSDLEQMTPVIIYGPGFSSGGLVSGTTRRDGLVATIDIGPTVLNALGIELDSGMSGSPMRTASSKISPASLDNFNKSAVAIKDARRTAVLAYIYIQIVLYILAALVLVFKRMRNKLSVGSLEALIFATMAFPLLSFYVAKLEFTASQGFIITALTVAVSLLLALMLMLVRKKVLQPIIGVSLLTLVVLSIDAITGSTSFINSIFGYDPIRGARFFGIGNEAMSILVANTLLLFGIMLEKAWNQWTILAGLAISALITIVIGFPGIGANTGGTIAAVSAFAAMFLQVKRVRISAASIAIGFAAVAVVLGSFVTYDAMHGSVTHMGKSANLIVSGGLPEIIMIIKRKLAMNFLILRYSTWSYFLLIALGILAFLWFRPVGILQRALVKHPGISAAITASLVGGVTGFIFNDSGILIPAIIMSYMIPTVVYLMLWEQYHSAR